MDTITRTDVDALTARLSEAGADWRAVVAQMPEVVEVLDGDATYRDRLVLGPLVQWEGGTYEATLYYAEHAERPDGEVGAWFSTGWSDASRAQVYRPTGFTLVEDEGGQASPVEMRLLELADAVRAAEREAETARGRRDEAIRSATSLGLSAYRVAQVTGMSQPAVKSARERAERAGDFFDVVDAATRDLP